MTKSHKAGQEGNVDVIRGTLRVARKFPWGCIFRVDFAGIVVHHRPAGWTQLFVAFSENSSPTVDAVAYYRRVPFDSD